MKSSSRRVVCGSVLFGLVVAGLGVWKTRTAPPAYAATQTPGRMSFISLPAIPPTGWAENDTRGMVPGNPQYTVAQMQQVYQMVQTFRQRNGGAYPNAQAKHSLMSDFFAYPKEYGISTMDDLKRRFQNRDMKYADGHQKDPQPESTFPYSFPMTRPDGTPKGGPKQAGTRDVLAYTDMYFHRNIRNFKDKAATNNPVGFYLVLWDDGQVEKVPFDKVEFAQPEARAMGSFTQTLVFPGEAGAPPRTIHYAEYNQWIHDHI